MTSSDQQTSQVDLTDVKALVARSEMHFANYNDTMRGLHRIAKTQDLFSGEFVYSLIFNGRLLISGKPILFDAANNLVAALDNLASAMVRENGVVNNPRIYYPFDTDSTKFGGKLSNVETHIGAQNSQILSAHYQQFEQEVTHVDALKKLANTGKHWALAVPTTSAHTIGMNQESGPQEFVTIPENIFVNGAESQFEFYRGIKPMWDETVYVIIKSEITGLTNRRPHSPDTIFRCSTRYVKGLINKIEDQSQH